MTDSDDLEEFCESCDAEITGDSFDGLCLTCYEQRDAQATK